MMHDVHFCRQAIFFIPILKPWQPARSWPQRLRSVVVGVDAVNSLPRVFPQPNQ